MITPPKKLPIDLSRVETAKGTWLIAVESAVETQSDGNLLLKIDLEQRVDEERFRTRELGILAPVNAAVDPECCASIVGRIRDWIDSTDGDGFVDLTQHGARSREA